MAYKRTYIHKLLGLMLLLIVVGGNGYAQQHDTSDKVNVFIQANDEVFTSTDSGQIVRFLGNAVFYQGTDTLYCDSLLENRTTHIIEAFSRVRIAQQGGTEGKSDYLRYVTNQKQAYMRGNVSLTDGKNKLRCPELAYNLGTKLGMYNKNGRLEADSTTVTSYTGEYNVKTKEAHFMGDVVVKDPQYTTNSEDMGYNTESKVTKFYTNSVVVADSGKTILYANSGTYDSHNQIAAFGNHSSIWYDGKYIEADTLYYNKLTGYGYGHGSVMALDTAHHSQLFCGTSIYYQKKRVMWAMVKPVMVQAKGEDTLYLRADTFYMAPVIKGKIPPKYRGTGEQYGVTPTTDPVIKSAADSAKTARAEQPLERKKKKRKDPKAAPLVAMDTTLADTTAPLYFTGYPHVLIFSDSMQGVCDSISYMQSDSLIRMMYDPVAWSRNSQITGDTIIAKLDSSRIQYIYVPNNAFVISLAGPPKAGLYDQIQGKRLKGYFEKNEINHLIVTPNAEAIYYTKDDNGAYIGVMQAKGDTMSVYFEDQKIKRIKLLHDIHQVLTPLEKADLPAMKLSRYRWLINRRPKSKEELFR